MPESRTESASVGLRHLETYCGPNPWSEEPCVLAELNIAPAALDDGPDRCARMVEACAPWLAVSISMESAPDRGVAIAAFLADWALALLNKGSGYLHAARGFRADGQLRMCVGYHDERLTLAAMTLATELFAQIDTADPDTIEANLRAFRRLTPLCHPDYQIRFLMRAARADGVPYFSFFREHRLWQFGWGKNGNLFFESEPKQDSAIGWKVARDKTATKAVFTSLGVPMAPHVLARSEADLPEAARTVGWPCVVKPAASGRSQGVTADVNSMAELAAAFRRARSLDKGHVMIERQVEGDVYRIVVARGKTACIVRRSAPYVIGDGSHTVRELIEATNEATAERRAEMPELLGPIPIDDELQAQLSVHGLELGQVVPAGTKVMLRRVPLLQTGAIYSDATAEAHPDIRTMAELMAESLGLAFCGIDFISRDISQSCAEEGAVLEINTTPGMRVPLVVGMAGEDIGRMVLGDSAGRIPVTLVLAAPHDLAALDSSLCFAPDQGWVVSDKCGLGTLPLTNRAGFADGQAPLRTADLVSRILRNPLAAELTIVCTPDELAEAGLPIDRYDTILLCRAALDPAWRDVLRQRAGRWIETQGPTDVMRHLAQPQ